MANSIITVESGWTGKGTSADPFKPTIMVEKGIRDFKVHRAKNPKKESACIVMLEVTPEKLRELQGDGKIADKIKIIRERGIIKPEPPKDDDVLAAQAAIAEAAVAEVIR